MAGGKYSPLTLTPINFSLTEGTSIPAPPDSPPDDPPRPPTPGKGPLSSHPTPKSAVFPQHEQTPPAKDFNPSYTNLQQTTTNDDASQSYPTSPASKRPSSVRKFLGLRPLSSHDSFISERPGSPATLNSQPGLSRKKSTSWFGRRKSSVISGPILEGAENKAPYTNGTSGTNPRRVSTVPQLHLQQQQQQQQQQPPQSQQSPPPKKKGPPPPALPELKSFGVSEDTLSLGAEDMFKNIK